MTDYSSTEAIFQVAKQSQKGTPATAGFITGMMQRSSLLANFDTQDKGAEHGITYTRATAHRTASRRNSYLARGQFRSVLYPDLFGMLLLGAGFAVTTTGAGANKKHTFKLAARDAYSWLTVMWGLGTKKRKASDCRVSQLVLDGGVDGVFYEGAFAGLGLDEALGSETVAAENTVGEMLPSNGSLSLVYDPAGAATEIVETPTNDLQRVQLTINNTLNEDKRSLHRFGRADLPQTGVDVLVSLSGVPVIWDLHDMIVNGAAAGTAPSTEPAIFSLVYSFESTADIAGAAVPYSVKTTIARLEMSLNDFQADGDNLVLWDLAGRMIDNTTDPIVIELESLKASY